MLVDTHFGGQAPPAVINRAILIYSGEGVAAATLHPAALDATGRPRIGAGEPLSRADLQSVIDELSPENAAASTRALLPENVLYADEKALLWWLPSQRRTLFFETGDKQFNADLNGRRVLQPALLFKAEPRSLHVFALAKSQRPDASTTVFRAPYFNTYERGHLCEGTYRLPEVCRAADLEKWEAGFFQTHFSHTNIVMQKLLEFEGGHNALWRAMLKSRAQHFPARVLAPALSASGKTQLTVAEVLNGN